MLILYNNNSIFAVHSESRLAQPSQVPVQPEATQVRVIRIFFQVCCLGLFLSYLMVIWYAFYHSPCVLQIHWCLLSAFISKFTFFLMYTFCMLGFIVSECLEKVVVISVGLFFKSQVCKKKSDLIS
jgi:hypothetical protein